MFQETDDPKKYYENDAKKHRLWGTQREISLSENILAGISRATTTLLDVGCGDGFFLSQACKALPGTSLSGVDLSEERLQQCRIRVPNVQFSTGNVMSLPFADRAREVVICSEVLEHVESPETALRELWRVSSRQLIVTVPNDQPTTQVDCPHCLGKFFLSGHIHRINAATLHGWAKGLGGSRVELRKFNTIFTYNKATLSWPKPLRMALDRAAVFSEPLAKFTKANYLLVAITR